MGLDTENIKKRLSQLEFDVKQMNQKIDENLDNNETTIDSTNDDNSVSNDALNVNNDDDTSMHEKDGDAGPQLEDNENKERDEIENEDENILTEHVNEIDKDNMRESISNQSYLQKEILEAIDNTQKSFIENVQHGTTDNNDKINNLTVDDNTPTDDQNTIREVVPEEKDGQKKEVVPEAEDESVGQQQMQELDGISDTTSTIIANDNNTNDKIQENIQTKLQIQSESCITELLINDQETVQDNNTDNTNSKENDFHNNTETQKNTSNSYSKHAEEEEEQPDLNENMNNISEYDDSNIPLEQIEQHPVEIDKNSSLAEVEREQNVDKQGMSDSQSINIQQTEDSGEISMPEEKDPLADNNDNEETESRTTASENKDEDEWEDLNEDTKEKNTNENNEIINKMENIPTDDNISLRQPSTVRYELSLNEDKIILPKHTNGKDITTTTSDNNNNNNTNISVSTTYKNQNIEDKSNSATVTIEKRKTTNPFRVISVSSPTSASSSRVSSTSSSHVPYSNGRAASFQKENNYNVNNDDNIMKLQNRHEYLMEKCIKLEKEIKYLRQMENQGSLTLEDGKKLNRAIDKLQEYLDRKTKERYEIGVLLSRHLRRQINRGENGEFWIGRK